MNPSITNQTLDALKAAQSAPNDALAKASTFAQSGSATSGITFYDLEAGAKLLFPVLTPLRNEIPRVSGKGGTQANWRAITAINANQVSAGVSGGNRGGMMNITTADYVAAYRGIGLEAAVDFEADYAAEGFDDAKALAAQTLLESLMIQEEQIILGGNNSVALGTTGTPTLTAAGTTSTLTASLYSVICVGLTMDGYLRASLVTGVLGQVTRANTDGSSDVFGGGSANKSVAATITPAATNNISASVTALPGAVAYAWYWGATGAELLGAITTINSVVISAAATGTQNASALTQDSSQNSLLFDGLLYQAFKPGSNSYIKRQATGTAGTGTPLTADGAGGIVEIDALLKSLWDNYRLSPTKILVNSQEQQNISTKILAGNANAAQRFVFTVEQGKIGGGVMVTSYRNKFSMNGAQEIPIQLHPNLPAGTVLVYTNKLPYPMSNVSNVIQVRTRKEYYQIEWPLRSRRYEYGVYADEVLQNYFPPSMGVITNIANG